MMKTVSRFGALFAAALTFAPLAAHAQPDIDATFARRAARGGIAEVRQAQAARVRSRNPEIVRFAERMTTDHSQANARLTQIMREEGRPIVTDEGGRNNAALAHLQTLHGRDFDRAYIDLQAREHSQMIGLFEDEINNGHDPRLQRYARRVLPVIQEHLRMAQRISSMM